MLAIIAALGVHYVSFEVPFTGRSRSGYSILSDAIHSTEWEIIEMMNEDKQESAVESATVHIDYGSHSMQFLYVPSTKGDGTAVFATNLLVGPEEAATFCRRYSRRWQIENEQTRSRGV